MVAKNKKEKNLNVYRLLRIARDIKVKDLAAELEVTPGYISMIEKGEKLPSRELLGKYAEALDVSTDLLYSFHPDSSGPHIFEKTLLKLLQKIVSLKEDDMQEE